MDEQRISSQFDDFIKKTYASLGAPPYDGSIFSAHVDGIDEDLPKLNESRSEIILKKMIKEYIGYMKFFIEKSSNLAIFSKKK